MTTIAAPKAYNTSALHRYIDNLDQQFRELRGSASMLYRKLIEINYKYNMRETFFCSDQDLMTATGFCWRTLSRAKKILIGLGLIQTKAQRGRGYATVYSLRAPKDFCIDNQAPEQAKEEVKEVVKEEPKQTEAPKKSLTIDDLKAMRCTNTAKYNWDGFIRKMEEFKPTPEELELLVKVSNYGEKGTLFWSCCAEINSARQTANPIKSPAKFILSRYRQQSGVYEDRCE